ncbi:hypothetical protein CXG81DRAFT_8896, partial [Caulochytrium protostelioides]
MSGGRIGHFQLGNIIGSGAFGKVYQGLNIESGAVVAVKQIRTHDVPKAELKIIRAEITLLKELSHPNIVSYVGFENTKDSIYIMMEYCESGSLQSIVKKFGRIGEPLLSIYMAQTLEGLVFLHAQGVIHRDLKAGNILTTKSGQIKLADFGVATRSADASKTVAGSPYWMAPEVIELCGASTASDIWSVGCTAIELYQGEPPYFHLGVMPALFRMVSDERPPFPEGISASLADFLMECFQKDPNLRIAAKKLLKHPYITKQRKQLISSDPDPPGPRPSPVYRHAPRRRTRRHDAPRPWSRPRFRWRRRRRRRPGADGDGGDDDNPGDPRRRGHGDLLGVPETEDEENWDADFTEDTQPSSSLFARVGRAAPGDGVLGLEPAAAALPIVPSQALALLDLQTTDLDGMDADFDEDAAEGSRLGRAMGVGAGAAIGSGGGGRHSTTSMAPTLPPSSLVPGPFGSESSLHPMPSPSAASSPSAAPRPRSLWRLGEPNIHASGSLASLVGLPTGTGTAATAAAGAGAGASLASLPPLSLSPSVRRNANPVVLDPDFDDRLEVQQLLTAPGATAPGVVVAAAAAREDDDEDDWSHDFDADVDGLDTTLAAATTAAPRLRTVTGPNGTPLPLDFQATCGALVDIFTTTPETRKVLITHHQVVVIMELLEQTREPAPLTWIMRVINSALTGDQVLIENLCLLGGIPVIVNLTTTDRLLGDRALRVEIAHFVKEVCSTSPLGLQMFISCRGLTIVAKLMQSTHYSDVPGDKAILYHMLDSMGAMFHFQVSTPKNEFCRLYAKLGLLPCLAELLHVMNHDTDERAPAYVAKLVELLVLFSQADVHIKEKLSEYECAATLMQELPYLNAALTVKLAKCLKNISMTSSTLDALQQCRMIEHFCQLLAVREGGPHFGEIQSHVINALFNLCRINRSRQEAAVRAGIVPHLQRFVASTHPMRQFALPILCELAHTSARTRESLAAAGGVESYLQLLGDQYWQVNALEALVFWLAQDPLRLEPAML